jgi:diguanylate cyclase (GGDEF)-like protein/PAS domain S-box-containing protein
MSAVKINRLIAEAMAAIPAAVFITERDGRIVWANKAFADLHGYAVAEVIGRNPRVLRSGRQKTAFYQDLWSTLLAGRGWRGELVDRRKDGTLHVVEEVAAPVRDGSGQITHFVALQTSLPAEKKERKRDRFLAYHDALTGLPNRTFFLGLMGEAIKRARRNRTCLALLFIDLDDFKPVNDTFGHHVGDLLLKAVAERLQASVRKSDTVARIGGDEFTVIQAELKDAATARLLARKLAQSVGQPYMIRQHRISIGASIGVAVYPADGLGQESLLDRADRAMYRAKLARKRRAQRALAGGARSQPLDLGQ